MNKLIPTAIISKELLDIYSPIPLNMEEDKILPFILEGQNYISEIIGKDLVEELQDEISNNLVSEDNQSLILEIAPALSMMTCYYALPCLAYQVNQKGITKENSDNSTPIDIKELSFLREDIKIRGDKACERLLDFLCSCSDLYPLFDKSRCSCENKNKMETLIYFPKTSKRNCNCK